jgi:hypothetical protein
MASRKSGKEQSITIVFYDLHPKKEKFEEDDLF